MAKIFLDNGASFVVSDEALIIKYYNEIVGEQWKQIAGYEGLYEVSNYGNVYSIRNKKILKLSKDNLGYLRVMLCKNDKQKSFLVHRLVAIAFIPNPENKATVNHIDEDKTNNHVYNLEWMSRGDNVRYSKCKKVLCIETGQPYDSMADAERETGAKNIGKACRGKQKTAGGFHWCFC